MGVLCWYFPEMIVIYIARLQVMEIMLKTALKSKDNKQTIHSVNFVQCYFDLRYLLFFQLPPL